MNESGIPEISPVTVRNITGNQSGTVPTSAEIQAEAAKYGEQYKREASGLGDPNTHIEIPKPTQQQYEQSLKEAINRDLNERNVGYGNMYYLELTGSEKIYTTSKKAPELLIRLNQNEVAKNTVIQALETKDFRLVDQLRLQLKEQLGSNYQTEDADAAIDLQIQYLNAQRRTAVKEQYGSLENYYSQFGSVGATARAIADMKYGAELNMLDESDRVAVLDQAQKIQTEIKQTQDLDTKSQQFPNFNQQRPS